MRSVLVAIDFVKDVDGSFKVLELNTGIAFSPISIEPYFNKTDFDNLLQQNNITEIDLVLLAAAPVIANNTDYPNDSIFGFGSYFDKYYTGLTVNKMVVKMDKQVMPIIEDSPNKLIIRQCYDSTALIDETYAKDNFEFLKLMYDASPTSIPNTYFNHITLGFDTIGNTVKDNGNYPNYIVKERYPTTNYNLYPKVYKINTIEELENLKNTLQPNTILQEYIFNPNDLENGKIKTYRSIGLIYGPNLDVINLFDTFIHTNACSVDMSVDTTNNEIQIWERPKYLQKYHKFEDDINYNSDSSNLILMSDGQFKSPQNIQYNDSIKTILIPGLNDGDSEYVISSFTGETTNVFTGSTFNNSLVKGLSTANKNVWIRNLNLSNGTKFSDIYSSKILIRRDSILRFVAFGDVKLTDEIVLVNKQTNEFEINSILSESYIFTNEMIYSIDVEDIDVYLTMDESTPTPNYFIIQHNAPRCLCWYMNLFAENWDCWDPCNGIDGLYTGSNYWECISLGYGAPFCNELICCRVEPLVEGGVNQGLNCPECQNVKQ